MYKIQVEALLPIDDFYNVINVLRDKCGCEDCERIANLLMGAKEVRVSSN